MKQKEKKFSQISTDEKVKLVAQWLDDKKGENIIALEVSTICQITEAVMIVSARTSRHAQALSDHILDMLGEQNIEYLGMEGHQGGEWILLDLNDIILHVFREETREYYNIEGLWSEGTPMELS